MRYDLAYWQTRVTKQKRWIEEHGGDLAGYIANYHGKYGRTLEQARAIWDADAQELQRLEDAVRGWRR